MRTYECPEQIQQQLSALPDQPGVYIFKDNSDAIIYIGKAANLRSRVRSYFNVPGWIDRPKLVFLVPKICSIETIVTNSEKEALLLEATLVRSHMPKYNVSLKDDKRYPWLCITYYEKFPRLIMVRDPRKHKERHPQAKIFGPYVQTGLMWDTVRALRKVFPMRQREKPLFKDRPCMNYHIGLCLAPCMKWVEEDVYNRMVNQVELFLSGQQMQVVDNLEKEMEDAAEALNFEQAAKIRDRLAALRSVLERQQVFFQDQKVSIDAWAEAHTERLAILCVMKVREGKLISQELFDVILPEKTTYDEAFQSFIEQYYAGSNYAAVPREVLLQHKIEDMEPLEDVLKDKAERSVKVFVPVRGEKLRLVEMATKNAALTLERQLSEEEGANAAAVALLSKVQDDLELSKLPRRIECFDISHIQGSDTVASMVVFENSRSKKSDYRTFKIKTVDGVPNDFASMKEVVARRYARLKEESKPFPDLVIIDGGKGQLNAALEALAELEITGLDIIGLAKRQEEVFKPGESMPRMLPRRSEGLFLLQRVRDEAHRFAITFHRKQRAKRALTSGFDDLPEIGPARRKLLMTKFSTFNNLKAAPLDEIKSVPGIPAKTAEAIWRFLHPEEKSEEQSQEDPPVHTEEQPAEATS